MMLLTEDVKPLYRQVAGAPKDEGGRIVMFLSAHAGEGNSSVASSFALLAAEEAKKPAWLLDLDLRRNHAFNTFAVGALSAKMGGVGAPYSALLKTQPFFSIEPADPDAAAAPGLFTAHRVGQTKLMVTQFDNAALKPDAVLQVRTQPCYWKAVKAATDWTIVDAPALERSSAGLVVASQADCVILVVCADATTAAEVAALKLEVERHGGRVMGVAMNRIKRDARLVERLAS